MTRVLELAKWILLVAVLGALTGSLVAFFLWSLDRITELRWANPSIVFFLPIAGVVILWMYRQYGGVSDRGNNLIIDEIHEPGCGVPRRMAPLVLGGTLVTHLFGGSAGREGTAVQMGGAIAAGVGRFFRLGVVEQRTLLMCGVAAGFSAVFGTPLAGTIFALEVLTYGRFRHDSLLPALGAALVGNAVCDAWGAHHTQ